jgi:hypothetical protein
MIAFALVLSSCAEPTDPESLTAGSGGYRVVGKTQTPGYAQDVEINDTLAFVAQGEGGLAILSVANPSGPVVLSVCHQGVRGYSYKLARKDSIVYLAAGGFGLNTINVAQPLAPAFMINYSGASSTSDVRVFGDWLLEGKGEKGVKFDDLAQVEPGYVSQKGEILCPGYAHGMETMSDSTLLIASGEMGLAIYDLKDIGRVEGFYDGSKLYETWIDLPGYAVDVRTMGDQRIAFVACGTAGVWVVDFSDTTARVIGSYSTGGYAKEVAYKNGRLYVTTELRGLQILSVTNPATPQLLGVVDTEFALGLAVGDRHVYVADEVEGLIIIAIPQ